MNATLTLIAHLDTTPSASLNPTLAEMAKNLARRIERDLEAGADTNVWFGAVRYRAERQGRGVLRVSRLTGERETFRREELASAFSPKAAAELIVADVD